MCGVLNFRNRFFISQHSMLSVLYKSHFLTQITKDQETKSHATYHRLKVTLSGFQLWSSEPKNTHFTQHFEAFISLRIGYESIHMCLFYMSMQTLFSLIEKANTHTSYWILLSFGLSFFSCNPHPNVFISCCSPLRRNSLLLMFQMGLYL